MQNQYMNPPSARAAALTAAIFIAQLIGTSGCRRPQSPPPPEPPIVEVAEPMVRDITEYFYYTGNLQSPEQVEIRARVPGYLASVNFDESSPVEENALLLTIEKEPYEIAVGRAKAALERAEAARKLADTNLKRVQELFRKQAATPLEMATEEAEYAIAEADVRANEEELAAAELDLSYTDVRTPIAGRVDRNYVDVGNLVGQGEPTLLARVVRLDPMRAWFDVSETIALRYLSKGRDGTVNEDAPMVELALADEEDFPHKGKVDFVDNNLDATTGTLRVRAVLPNPTRKLYPGLFARVRVPWTVRENAVLIEEEAVGTGLEGKYVLTLDADNKVKRNPVELGERQPDGTVLVLEGLTHEDTYIVRGLQKARPGGTVNPKAFVRSKNQSPESSKSPDDRADVSKLAEPKTDNAEKG